MALGAQPAGGTVPANDYKDSSIFYSRFPPPVFDECRSCHQSQFQSIDVHAFAFSYSNKFLSAGSIAF